MNYTRISGFLIDTEDNQKLIGDRIIIDGVDFEERMAEIHRELLSLQKEANDLMDTISQNMKEMGI